MNPPVHMNQVTSPFSFRKHTGSRYGVAPYPSTMYTTTAKMRYQCFSLNRIVTMMPISQVIQYVARSTRGMWR